MNHEQVKFLLYKTEDSDVGVDVIISDDTIWTTQKSMAELFGVDKSTISRHLRNIFEINELSESTTVAKIATVVNNGFLAIWIKILTTII